MQLTRSAKERASVRSGCYPVVSRYKPWVLVVDDDVVSGRSTARWLAAKTGARVLVARSLRDACQMVRSASFWPSAIVLDYDLGGPSGVRVLSALRRLGCPAPGAFLTGAPEKVELALRCGRHDERIEIFSRAERTERLANWVLELKAEPLDSLFKSNQLQFEFHFGALA